MFIKASNHSYQLSKVLPLKNKNFWKNFTSITFKGDATSLFCNYNDSFVLLKGIFVVGDRKSTVVSWGPLLDNLLTDLYKFICWRYWHVIEFVLFWFKLHFCIFISKFFFTLHLWEFFCCSRTISFWFCYICVIAWRVKSCLLIIPFA